MCKLFLSFNCTFPLCPRGACHCLVWYIHHSLLWLLWFFYLFNFLLFSKTFLYVLSSIPSSGGMHAWWELPCSHSGRSRPGGSHSYSSVGLFHWKKAKPCQWLWVFLISSFLPRYHLGDQYSIAGCLRLIVKNIRDTTWQLCLCCLLMMLFNGPVFSVSSFDVTTCEHVMSHVITAIVSNLCCVSV